MSSEHPLKTSISKRLSNERHIVPKDKKKPKQFPFQLIIILSIIMGLIFSVINIIGRISFF